MQHVAIQHLSASGTLLARNLVTRKWESKLVRTRLANSFVRRMCRIVARPDNQEHSVGILADAPGHLHREMIRRSQFVIIGFDTGRIWNHESSPKAARTFYLKKSLGQIGHSGAYIGRGGYLARAVAVMPDRQSVVQQIDG